MLQLQGKTVVLSETGQPFKSLATGAVQPYTGYYHEQVGNFAIGRGQVFTWLYTNPEAIAKLSSAEYDLVMFPPGRSAAMAMRHQSVLDEAWKANRRRGHAELMAVIDGWLCDNADTPTLLIRRMSVRKCYRRNGLNTQLIRVLHGYFPDRALAFEDLTEEGYKFVQATFPEAAHIWTKDCAWRPKDYREPGTVSAA